MAGNILKPRFELEKALETISKGVNFQDAHLELASDGRAEDIVTFLRDNFFCDETCCKSIGLEMDETIRQSMLHRLRENISVLVVSNVTGEIIAARTMATVRMSAPIDISKITNKNAFLIQTFLRHKDKEMDVYKKFGVDTYIHFIALAVSRDHRGKGIATKLMNAAILFSKELGLSPVCIKGEGTSNYSQRIYNKFGFETIHTMLYEDYKVNREVVFKNTGNNKSTKIFMKQL